MKKSLCFATVFSLSTLLAPSSIFAKTSVQGTVIIETRILDLDPQAGMKSTQKIDIIVDTTAKTISTNSSFETGTTDFFGIKLSSVRDNFRIEKSTFDYSRKEYSVTVVGETASGVRALPSIDYRFEISYSGAARSNIWTVQGCHDGYPAYKVSFFIHSKNRTDTLYEFKHKSKELLNLFGSCDVKVNTTKTISYR